VIILDGQIRSITTQPLDTDSAVHQAVASRQDLIDLPLAARSCDLMQTSLPDGPNPGPGRAVFYLVSGNAGGVEGSLGTNSAGVVRTNTNPCP